jgi:hypothetical protein
VVANLTQIASVPASIMGRETDYWLSEGDIAERGRRLPARRSEAHVLTHRSPWIRFLRRAARERASSLYSRSSRLLAGLWERTFANGDRDAHRIGLDDWPILLKLERAGKLTFRDYNIRERYQRMKPISDDPS